MDISNRTKLEEDSEYYYPIADCTSCGAKDVPFNSIYMPSPSGYSKLTYCLNCHQGELGKVKGYVSLIDLEDTDWSIEL